MEHKDKLRATVVNLMADFMRDEIYADQDIPLEELVHSAAVYYDLVSACTKAVQEGEKAAIKEAKRLAEAGIIDASNPTQVDLMGGPGGIGSNTLNRG